MSNGPQFFETRMGQQFYDGTMRRLVVAAESIAASLEQLAAHDGEDRALADEARHEQNVVRAAWLLANDPGKREDEDDAGWHDRLSDWCAKATDLARRQR